MLTDKEIRALQEEIEGYAREYGLDFYPVVYQLVDWDQMNEIAAYGGFPTRYPHWTFGMEYERLAKSYAYGLSKIYEMVINTNPVYAYLLECNAVVDQKLVIAHVCGHADFFKHNIYFAHTNRKMMDEIANHGMRVRRYMAKYGQEEVENFIDACLSIEDLIDIHSTAIKRREDSKGSVLRGEEESVPTIGKLQAKDYMDAYINPKEFIEEQKRKLEEERKRKKKFPERPEKDVLLFLIENAPLENWQRDVLDIIREEAYYFAPQAQTKILNEGWACMVSGSLLYTERGLLRIEDIVNQRLSVRVSDGQTFRYVYDWAKFENRETVWVRTRRGLEMEGSVTHRLMLPDGSWRRLDEIKVGDRVRLGAGQNQWATDYVLTDWQPQRRTTLEQVAERAGVDIETVICYRRGVRGRHSEKLATLVADHDAERTTMTLMQNKRRPVSVPTIVDEKLAAFLGYLMGDGHISEVQRVISLTTGDEEQSDRFIELTEQLFDVTPRKKWDDGRWRVFFHSKDVEDFLKHLGLKTGRCARVKDVPDVILHSPKEVVAAFLRAYFDCDGYAGRAGVILSAASESMSKTVQLLLLNFGILSTRRPHKDGCWHVHITGQSAALFQEQIGFGLRRKHEALQKYVEERQWFKEEKWEDEVIAVERRRADVYDISVEETHRYAAQGFINHNSFWHSTIMTQKAMRPSELVDYAEHHSGTMGRRPGRINPYKLGLELLRDIEERWNKGQFGKEWEECDDLATKRNWDKQLGLGRQKIFEVRKIHNDVTFIDTFLTPEFVAEQKLFTYEYNSYTEAYEIASREFNKIKQKLLFSLTNFGKPFIYVIDGNYENRGELYLKHNYEGIDLKIREARDTLKNLYKIWQRPVHLETVVDGWNILLSFNGSEHQDTQLKSAE